MLDSCLVDLTTFTPDFHLRVVNTLFSVVLAAITDSEAALGVIIRVHLAVLTAYVPLAFLCLSH